ncbi:hypothetical protein C0991_012476 [Blastosporella zonata]|nr:hypothetical protein C0991_012476 [Blastosporella zonata]
MHHTLEISDILGCIFSFTDVNTNARCALVCKAWLENALDALWHRIDRLEHLLRILGPMGELRPSSPPLVTFLQFHIASERWDRFSFYSRRIRRLEVIDRYPEIHQQVFSMISIARPFLRLLPNLTHLTWEKDPSRPAVSLALCLLFLTPTLKSLSVETGHLHSDDGATEGDLFAIDNFFKDVMHRSPQIEALHFLSEIPFRALGPSLPLFLIGLPNLKTVMLAEHLLTSDVFTALATCPRLQSIRMSTTDLEVKETDDLQHFMPVIEPGAFPCLREMGIKAHLWNLMSFLQSNFPAERLRHLVVQTIIIEEHDNIASFFKFVADTCPNIEVLSLMRPYDVLPETTAGLPFACLEPLLGCTSMTSFNLITATPLNMNNSDVEKLAAAWPRLQELCLNPRQGRMNPEGDHITFEAMKSFAVHCPLLRNLELQIESYLIPPPDARKLIPKLESLVLGLVASSYAPEELAGFLTDITPPKCRVGGMPYILVEYQDYVHIQVNAAQSKLEKAFSLIPTLRNIHAQYRERLRSLEAEVERLSALGASSRLS